MGYKSPKVLQAQLKAAENKVRIGSKYFHYKSPKNFYTLTDLIIIEETEEVGVVYKAEYKELKGVKFMRPLTEFLSDVSMEDKIVKRFTLVE